MRLPAAASALALAAALVAAPALAASPGSAPGSPANSAAQNAPPPQRNPVLTKDGRVRASRVIGSAVYDGHDQKIGTIDDILLDTGDQQAGGQQVGDQQAGDQHGAIAVISVGGFLGIGSKLVAVPYSKLQFGNTSKNSDNRVVMPDATKAALNGMPSYHYLPGKA